MRLVEGDHWFMFGIGLKPFEEIEHFLGSDSNSIGFKGSTG